MKKQGWHLISVKSNINISEEKNILHCYSFESGKYKSCNIMEKDKAYWIYYSNIESKQMKKHALFILGDVNYYGFNLTSHHKVAKDTKDFLVKNREFTESNVIICKKFDEVKNEINNLKSKLSKPYNYGILWYTGHGSKKSSSDPKDGYTDEYWDHGNVSDNLITDLINSIHEKSQLVIIADNCFSDGMIDDWNIKNKNNWLFISSARENGSDEYTSAYFTGDGGFMTYSLLNNLPDNKKINGDEIKKILHDKYFNDGGNIKHKPVIKPDNSKVCI